MGPSAVEGREPLFASVFSVLWLLGLGAYGAGYFGLIGEGVSPAGPVSLEILLFVFAAVLPIILVWIGVLLLRRTAEVQRDARDLATAVKKFQTDPLSNRTARIIPAGSAQADTQIIGKFDTLTAQLQQVELALATLISGGQAVVAMPPATDGEKTADTANPSSPNWDELLQALNFPMDEKDNAGFRALRIAMKHGSISLCIRATEDIMNLMAQDSIYMDDFKPQIAPATLWRAVSAGERGEEVAAVGGIYDEETIARVSERMTSDTIFRDAARHFQRQFDVVLKLFCDQGSDALIERLGNTRTGRTFMLIGRVDGIFG